MTAVSVAGNVVAANNMFDVHYISYHANISALYLPSWLALHAAPPLVT